MPSASARAGWLFCMVFVTWATIIGSDQFDAHTILAFLPARPRGRTILKAPCTPLPIPWPLPAAPAAAAKTISPSQQQSGLAMHILGAVAFVHLLNDLIQALLPSIYPMLKAEFALSFTQVGLITLTFQCTASLLQPWIGLYTDRRPLPFLLPVGMCFTLAGVLMLSIVSTFPTLLIASGPDRRRFLDLPPGSVARGAHGLGRALRLCAVAVPGGRQCGFGAGSAAGGGRDRRPWPGQYRLVQPAGGAGHRRADQRQPLV